jgi:ketosteroid isomerase-like protein
MSALVRWFATSLVLAGAAVAAAQPGPSAADPETAVRRLERQWLDAYETYDVAAMERIVADDFAITFPDGSQQTKAQILAMLRRPRNPARPPTRFHTEDVRARVRDGVVILSGVVVATDVRDGKPVEDRMRYTDTWVRAGASWQVLASGLSSWTPPRPAPRDTTRSASPDSAR